MTTKLATVAGWPDARAALVATLQATYELLQDAPYSAAAGSTYQRGHAQAERILDQLRLMALINLKQVDDAVAASDLVQQLGAEAKAAKAAADQLKKATATIKKISGVVDDVVKVIDKFLGLPFL